MYTELIEAMSGKETRLNAEEDVSPVEYHYLKLAGADG